METADIRHMRHVHLRKIGLLALLLLVGSSLLAQFNYQERSRKKIYFGIALGINMADYKPVPYPLSPETDSVTTFEPSMSLGFNLGIVGNWQFNKYFDLRFIPALNFSDKRIDYQLSNGASAFRTISSIALSFPLQVRFKSQPIKDTRIFVLGGFRYDFDLASNAKNRRADDQVKVNAHDLMMEFGVGVQVYFPFFIFSPELKVSHGIIDLHARDQNLVYSSVIDKLFSRFFTVTINFEG